MRNVNSPDIQTLHDQQIAFAACIRDPRNSHAIASVDADRMALYHELFYNNFAETLSSAFPVLVQVLNAGHWQQLCRHFFAQHHCVTPYLSHMPGEFVGFLKNIEAIDPPWLPELAQWEWTELELMLAPDPVIPKTINDDVVNRIPVLSPLLRLHAFDFPVHEISTGYLPESSCAQKNYLAAWRKQDDTIAFMQVNAFSHRLLQLLGVNQKQTGLELLNLIASEQTEYDPAVIIQGGIEMLQCFYQKNILAGAIAA